MPAAVDTMASVREMPWHGLGVILEDFPQDWASMRKAAGLEWDPIEEPQYRLNGINAETGLPIYDKVEDYKYVVRSDTGKILSSVNSTYHIIDHTTMGEAVEALLQVDDVPAVPKYETAGALEGGERVWVLAQLGDDIELPGDFSPTRRYLALTTDHTAKGAFKAMGTGVRIVCANTWHAADVSAEKAGTAFSFRHGKNWKSQIEMARGIITGAYGQMDKYVAAARQAMAVKIKSADMDELVEKFAIERTLMNMDAKTRRIPLKDLMAKPTVTNSLAATKVTMTQILKSETCDGLDNTAYKFLQAAGEFADHFKPAKNADTYFSRSVLQTEPLKVTAHRLAMAYA